MARLTLRKSTNYQLIAGMDSKLFPEDYPVTDWIDSTWWVGYISGKPVCYCGIKKITEQDYGYMIRAGVMPEAQGCGIQKKMINRRLEYAKDMGWSHVITDTTHDNYASINSLIGVGFKVYQPGECWANEYSLYWIKSL